MKQTFGLIHFIELVRSSEVSLSSLAHFGRYPGGLVSELIKRGAILVALKTVEDSDVSEPI